MRTIVVTGAARGIGAATAQALATSGDRIVCLDTDGAGVAALADAITASGGMAVGRSLDVTDRATATGMIAAIAAEFGSLDGLVNNAGITRDALVHKMTDDQWDAVIAVNLTAVFTLSRAAATVMRAQGSGRIVNLSSIAWEGNIGQVNYSASKAGVVGITCALAKELARFGVTVNAIAPGFISTEMTRAMPPEVLDKLAADVPLGRLGTVQDVAGVVAFLLSDAASYITGEVLGVNGGLRI